MLRHHADEYPARDRDARDSDDRDERGSVAMVVMVLFVMASLATVMVARDMSELRSVRTSQDRSVALAATDAGMAAGVARAAVETSDGFSERGTAGDAEWALRARRISTDRWELLVVATANVSQRAASAGLVRRGGSGWVLADWQEGAGQYCNFQDTLQQANESQQLLNLQSLSGTQPRLSTGTRINTAEDQKICRALLCTSGDPLEQADQTQQTLQQANQTQQRLSTGKRINSAADDAAGLAAGLRSCCAGDQTLEQANQDVLTLLQGTDESIDAADEDTVGSKSLNSGLSSGTKSCQSQICDTDMALESAQQRLQSLNSANDDAAGLCDESLLNLTR